MITIAEVAAASPRFARFARRHPAAAKQLVRITDLRFRDIEPMADQDQQDDRETLLIDRIVRQAHTEHAVTFGIIGTILVGVIVRLIVDYIFSNR